MRVLLTVLAVSPLIALTSASAADFTGTYTGFVNCSGTGANGEKLRDKNPVTLQISQPNTWANHASLNLLVNGFAAMGRVIFNPKKPDQMGNGIVNDCTHIQTPNSFIYEISHFSGTVNPGNGKGMIKFTTIVDWTGIDGSIGTCKGVVKRISRDDPNVGFCE